MFVERKQKKKKKNAQLHEQKIAKDPHTLLLVLLASLSGLASLLALFLLLEEESRATNVQ